MTQVNVQGLIKNTLNRVGIYTAIEEAVVNAIHSIEESERKDGEIKIVIHRVAQAGMGFQDDALPPVFSIEITDNGVGFTQKNRNSFDTVFSDMKAEKGGKGFGRFAYLKCFNDVSVESVYIANAECRRRKFTFKREDEIISNEVDKKMKSDTVVSTTVSLNGLKKGHQDKVNKKVDTVARKLLERILFYFSLENFDSPRITIIDSHTGDAVTLNDLVGEQKDISVIDEGKVKIESQNKSKQEFRYKVYRVFYPDGPSKINLIANNRLVTSESLYEYIPDIKGDFVDEDSKGRKRNFAIQVYVSGQYLDDYVTFDRNSFLFEDDRNLLSGLSKIEIEKEISEKVKTLFPEEFKTRFEHKRQRIEDYVDENAFWHKAFIDDLDMDTLSHDADDQKIEEALQRIKIKKESEYLSQATAILSDDKKQQSDKVQEIVENLTEVSKSDLAHYVATRRVVLDMFKRSLEWDDKEKYELEQAIHDIIFPTRKTSSEVPHWGHNLWILDERLNFHKYLMSDKPLEKTGDRPDIAIFSNKIAVRGSDEVQNPILVFEFKRPQRTEYSPKDNPLVQIGKYIQQIRDGKCVDATGRGVNANKNTPAFGYLICDLTPKVREFCDQFQLVETPDNEGYVGYHKSYDVYFEVYSFSKIMKDAELRNKIFFNTLKI